MVALTQQTVAHFTMEKGIMIKAQGQFTFTFTGGLMGQWWH
jgi:hypothetical protein